MSGTYARVSQLVAEALAAGVPAARVSQVVIEALAGPLGYARASQLVLEALAAPLGYARASQLVMEVLAASVGYARASQAVVEALAATLGYARVSQLVLEVLVFNHGVGMPAVYPTLIGLGYSVIKRPIWNTSVGMAASGRDARAALQANVLYEWDLVYDYLSDNSGVGSSTYTSDLKTLMGFFNSVAGGAFSFCFTDPDDCQVTGQSLGTTDGVTTNWTFQRTFGGGDGGTTEPVGYLNQTVAPNIYLNGALQNASTYTLLTTNPYAQQVKFNTAPATGLAVTADFSFYYGVRFKDDNYDFEKFANLMWGLKKVTLKQVRGS